MTKRLKEVTELDALDLAAFPIWEFAINREATSDTLVRPVEGIPVNNLDGRLVGAQVRFANGHGRLALLGNVDLANAKSTRHFLTLSILSNGEWLYLARYFDANYEGHGQLAFAARLGLRVSDIFPIRYDIRPDCIGDPEVTIGTILAEPLEKLTATERIALAVGRAS